MENIISVQEHPECARTADDANAAMWCPERSQGLLECTKKAASATKCRRTTSSSTAELVAREMSLRDLRKALGKTQAAMADRLGIKQENVSRIEQRSDMLLSTLNNYLRGMGGRLRLVAEFAGCPPVELTGLADVVETEDPPRAVSAQSGTGARR